MTPAAAEARVPPLRFPGFTAPWEERPLAEFLQEKRRLNRDRKLSRDAVLSVSGDAGIVNQIEHLGRSFAGEDLANYKIVEVGDIVYTKSPIQPAPYGIIKLNRGNRGIVSTLYAVYAPVGTNRAEFIDHYFSLSDRLNGYLRPLVHIGAKNDMKINNERVLVDPVIFPGPDEQQKIAEFLGGVDRWVAGLRARRDALADYKRGVMQRLFSRQLRFTRPDGTPFPDWQEKRLGEVADRVTNRNEDLANTRVLTNSASQGIIDQGDFFDRDIANADNIAGYYLSHLGDFIYNPRISATAPVGPINRNDLGTGIFSPLYTVFRFHDDETGFVDQYFKSTAWHYHILSVANYGARHDRISLSVADFENMPIPVAHPEEQRKIAGFLGALDRRIDAVTAQITTAEAFKRGLLQQMFV